MSEYNWTPALLCHCCGFGSLPECNQGPASYLGDQQLSAPNEPSQWPGFLLLRWNRSSTKRQPPVSLSLFPEGPKDGQERTHLTAEALEPWSYNQGEICPRYLQSHLPLPHTCHRLKLDLKEKKKKKNLQIASYWV